MSLDEKGDVRCYRPLVNGAWIVFFSPLLFRLTLWASLGWTSIIPLRGNYQQSSMASGRRPEHRAPPEIVGIDMNDEIDRYNPCRKYLLIVVSLMLSSFGSFTMKRRLENTLPSELWAINEHLVTKYAVSLGQSALSH